MVHCLFHVLSSIWNRPERHQGAHYVLSSIFHFSLQHRGYFGQLSLCQFLQQSHSQPSTLIIFAVTYSLHISINYFSTTRLHIRSNLDWAIDLPTTHLSKETRTAEESHELTGSLQTWHKSEVRAVGIGSEGLLVVILAASLCCPLLLRATRAEAVLLPLQPTNLTDCGQI